MIKKLVSLILLIAFSCSLISFMPETALAKKYKKVKKVKKIKKSGRRFYRRVFFKAYREYCLIPKIKAEDQSAIIESLKSGGVNSVKIDSINNSLILQFSAEKVSALDIMQTLKDLGYSVSSIN
ncbi:MAG: hypothetical protein WC624_03645 [Candidatus Margulisiibacteriota bacterium]